MSTTVLPAARAGAIFQASISSGKFQGMTCAATPSGRGVASGERVLELVRPAGVVPEVRGRERHVDVARLLDGLAAVERLEDRELAAALLEDARDAEQVLGALAPGQRAPVALGRLAARRSTAWSTSSTPARATSASGSSVAGSMRREPLAAARRDLLAADEQAVARLELDDVARLGRRRVLPRHRLAVAQAPARRGARVSPHRVGSRSSGDRSVTRRHRLASIEREVVAAGVAAGRVPCAAA